MTILEIKETIENHYGEKLQFTRGKGKPVSQPFSRACLLLGYTGDQVAKEMNLKGVTPRTTIYAAFRQHRINCQKFVEVNDKWEKFKQKYIKK
jgi:hypothetical protein